MNLIKSFIADLLIDFIVGRKCTPRTSIMVDRLLVWKDGHYAG